VQREQDYLPGQQRQDRAIYGSIYRERRANRTAAGSSKRDPVCYIHDTGNVTTTYALVSVTDANGCVRNAAFTGGSAVITVNTLPQGSLTANGPFCATGSRTSYLDGKRRHWAIHGSIYRERREANRTAAGVVSGTPFATFTTPVTVTTTYALYR